MELEQLRYPVGKFIVPTEIDRQHIQSWKATIQSLPQELNALVKDLSVTERNWIYRPDGWSIKQVIHHLADSHMNSFIRFKLTLTENVPEVRPYEEHKWALTADGQDDNRRTQPLGLSVGYLNRRRSGFVVFPSAAPAPLFAERSDRDLRLAFKTSPGTH